jgi:dTDP-4-dehydrorhamnose 3,5-epimerase
MQQIIWGYNTWLMELDARERQRMEFIPASIHDIKIIKPTVFRDGRGFFMETFQAERFAAAGIPTHFVQDNHSGSARGTLRGLHYQIRHAQGKLVRVVAGEVYDVAIDLRRSSKTFGKWIGMRLSSENHAQLWIPAGFAHGFYVLSEWAEVIYKTTDFYAPTWERTLMWNDAELGIEWPVHPGQPPIVSEKDQQGIRFRDAELFD